jgi:hypothetical protein
VNLESVVETQMPAHRARHRVRRRDPQPGSERCPGTASLTREMVRARLPRPTRQCAMRLIRQNSDARPLDRSRPRAPGACGVRRRTAQPVRRHRSATQRIPAGNTSVLSRDQRRPARTRSWRAGGRGPPRCARKAKRGSPLSAVSDARGRFRGWRSRPLARQGHGNLIS